jgi:hypothetical protein
MRVPFTAVLAAFMLVASGAVSAAAAPVDPARWLEVDVVAQPLRPPAQAPADEYFGVQRLSNLGIRSMLHDMMIEGTSPLALPLQMQRMAGIESAFPPWLEKYPDDSWLPREMIDFAIFLQSKQQPFTDDLAAGYLLYLSLRFPTASAGKTAARMLASYEPVAPFDILSIPNPALHTGVPDYIFPKIRRR